MRPAPARLSAALLLLAPLLSACGSSDQPNERDLEAACQDNRSRAFAAAQQAAVGGKVSEAEALSNMRTYIAEVRKAPGCFSDPLRMEVERAAAAVEHGQVLKLEYPKFGA